MPIISLSFITFLIVIVVAYFRVSEKHQWIVLLIASGAFYLSVSPSGAFFVLITISTVYVGTNQLQKLTNDQKEYIKKNRSFQSFS